MVEQSILDKHIVRIDLENKGFAEEVVSVKTLEEQWQQKPLYFIRIRDLDDVDKKRLIKVLKNPNAGSLPMWDLLSQSTLGNGMNALEYFHQIIQVRNPDGKIYNSDINRM